MRRKQHFITITLLMTHHYCIVDTAIHGQGIFKTMIHFHNHERKIYTEADVVHFAIENLL